MVFIADGTDVVALSFQVIDGLGSTVDLIRVLPNTNYGLIDYITALESLGM